MAAINFDSQAVKKQAKLLEEAADQIQNQTIKVINAANEAVAASWSGKAGGIFVKFMQEQYKAACSVPASRGRSSISISSPTPFPAPRPSPTACPWAL